ncbi:hypothetical protein ABW19_dt0204214 [Dactylella cylindrospora]|nr:hypothetical protein ABW19_dt0204214 [Dactylella cylindrospora]
MAARRSGWRVTNASYMKPIAGIGSVIAAMEEPAIAGDIKSHPEHMRSRDRPFLRLPVITRKFRCPCAVTRCPTHSACWEYGEKWGDNLDQLKDHLVETHFGGKLPTELDFLPPAVADWRDMFLYCLGKCNLSWGDKNIRVESVSYVDESNLPLGGPKAYTATEARALIEDGRAQLEYFKFEPTIFTYSRKGKTLEPVWEDPIRSTATPDYTKQDSIFPLKRALKKWHSDARKVKTEPDPKPKLVLDGESPRLKSGGAPKSLASEMQASWEKNLSQLLGYTQDSGIGSEYTDGSSALDFHVEQDSSPLTVSNSQDSVKSKHDYIGAECTIRDSVPIGLPAVELVAMTEDAIYDTNVACHAKNMETIKSVDPIAAADVTDVPPRVFFEQSEILENVQVIENQGKVEGTDGSDQFREVIIQQAAATIKAYAVGRAVQIVRQLFFFRLVHYIQQFGPGGIPCSDNDTTDSTGTSKGSGTTTSWASGGTDSSSNSGNSNHRQSSKGKRKADSNDGSSGDGEDDDGDDGDGNRRKKTRIEKPIRLVPAVRYACIFFAHAMYSEEEGPSAKLALAEWPESCYGTGFETMARLKTHLCRQHRYGCAKCKRIFPSGEKFYEHYQQCTEIETPGGKPTSCLTNDQFRKIEPRAWVSGISTPEKQWTWVYKTVFGDQDKVPSPYWQPLSLKCNKQHIDSNQRNELFELLREQFESAIDMRDLSDPLIRGLLKSLKDIWERIVESVAEKYPVSQDIGESDVELWKRVFPAKPMDFLASEGIGGIGGSTGMAYEPIDRTMGNQTCFDTRGSGLTSASEIDSTSSGAPMHTDASSFLGFDLDNTRLDYEDYDIPLDEWLFNPMTGEALNDNFSYFPREGIE